jgi:preprotein translocase subunit SecE
MKALQNYFKDVIQEMKKVSWPTRDELKDSTIVVIFFSLIMAVFTGGVDYILTLIVNQVIGSGQF